MKQKPEFEMEVKIEVSPLFDVPSYPVKEWIRELSSKRTKEVIEKALEEDFGYDTNFKVKQIKVKTKW